MCLRLTISCESAERLAWARSITARRSPRRASWSAVERALCSRPWPDAGADGVETIGDDFAHRPQTPGQFGVHARQVGHAVIEFALAFGRRESLEAARIRRAHDGYENSAQQKQTQRRSREGRVGERDLRASQSEENVRHGASLRDSPAETRTNNEQICWSG